MKRIQLDCEVVRDEVIKKEPSHEKSFFRSQHMPYQILS